MPDLRHFAFGSRRGHFEQVFAVDRVSDIEGFRYGAGHLSEGVRVNPVGTDGRFDDDPQEGHRVGARAGHRIQFQSRACDHGSQQLLERSL